MRRFFKSKTFWVVAICILAVAAILIYGKLSGAKTYKDKYADLDMNQLISEGRSDTYGAYLLRHSGAAKPQQTVEVSLNDIVEAKSTNYKYASVGGVDNALVSYEGGAIELTANVPEEGFYYIFYLMTYESQ